MIRHINYPRSLPTELLVHSHAPHSAQTNPGERLPKLSWKASSCQRAFYNSVQGAVVAPPAPRQIRRSAGGAAQAVSRREAGSGALTARRRRKEETLLHPDSRLSPSPGPRLPAEAATCGTSGEKRRLSPARGACAAVVRERPVSQRRPPGAPRARRTSGCRGAAHRRLPPAVGGVPRRRAGLLRCASPPVRWPLACGGERPRSVRGRRHDAGPVGPAAGLPQPVPAVRAVPGGPAAPRLPR